MLPSLPSICVKIKQIAARPESDASSLGKAARVDPAFCGYLLKVSNSPQYRGNVKVTNINLAIGRLGMENTCNLARLYAIRSLFKSKKRSMQAWLQRSWEISTHTASVASVIAENIDTDVDPEQALLAGLVQDIGCLSLISEASDYPELINDDQAMEVLFDSHAATLGAGIVKEWGLGEEFIEVVRNRDNWSYNDSSEVNLVDIVQVAKLHTYLAYKKALQLPKLSSVPSFQKVMLNQHTSPEQSLQFVADAKQRITSIIRNLGG
ncbi:HDOD domain-containing protein [Aliikangiella marina]|nr:HDOD domain-containing protein [Aliikangiella marina]